MTSVVEGLLSLAGAMGIFLYAISRFGDGVQKMAGERIRAVLETQATEPLSSVGTGIGIAAALQSNVLTFGMISSLVNAGLLGLLPAVLTMLGVNLGITVTAQLISINIGAFAFLLLFIGYAMNFYGKKRNWHYLGQVIFNLALMYIGFELFHRAFQVLAFDPTAARLIKSAFANPWLGFLIGLSLATLLRSSNTVVVLVQGIVGVMALFSPSLIGGAFAIIIGANVGTTIINMLVGLDRLPIAKKANWLHFTFNFLTALFWLALLPIAISGVHAVSSELGSAFQWFEVAVFRWQVPAFAAGRWFNIWELAMAHTLFNTSVILIWLPVSLMASKLGFSLFAEQGKIGVSGTTYLDRRALQSPALALILACHEINQMAMITLEMLKSARLSFLKGQVHLIAGIAGDETIVDDLQEQITFYLSALLSQNSLTESQSHRLAGLLHIVSDIERVGDHANNIANLAEKKHQEQLPFSEIALNEMELFFGKTMDVYSKACQSLRENNLELAKQIQTREANIDKLEEELQQNHIHRLNQGKCWPGSGVVYVEILSNLERVAAHSANISVVILEEGEE